MTELVSIPFDSGRAGPQTMNTWPGAEVAQWLCLLLTDCTFMLKNHDSLSASHQRRYTDKPSPWMDLSGKRSCVRSHSLFLQRSMSTGTRIVTCRLTRAGAASWVDFTDNRSTLTEACNCCACRSILHDIQCSSKRHAHCHRDVAWDSTVVGEWTAWPSNFENHPSVVSRSDLSETSKLLPCCPLILDHCSGCVSCFACRLQGCFPYVESTTCFSLQLEIVQDRDEVMMED